MREGARHPPLAGRSQAIRRAEPGARALKGVSARTLTKQLRELEADGIIDRKVYHQIPPMVECSLTAVGEKLEPILLAMHVWGEEFEARVRQRSCDEPLWSLA